MIVELVNISFNNKVSLVQHEISLLSEESNFHLVKYKQRFLIKSFCSRILAVKNYTEDEISDSLKYLSSKQRFIIVSLLYYKKDLFKYYNLYVVKKKGVSFSFDFSIIYYLSFCHLIKLSILPFLETRLHKFFFVFRPYKINSDSLLKINYVLLSDFNKLWFLKFKIFSILNSVSKLWLLRNFPLENFFLNFYFEQKTYKFCKSFFLTIFSYLLKGLVRIKN